MRTEMIRKFDLTGKKAIITGVGSLEGIGRYLAEGLCESGRSDQPLRAYVQGPGLFSGTGIFRGRCSGRFNRSGPVG